MTRHTTGTLSQARIFRTCDILFDPIHCISAHKCTPTSQSGDSINLFHTVSRLCLHHITQRAGSVQAVKRVTGDQYQGIPGQRPCIQGLPGTVHHPGGCHLITSPLPIHALQPDRIARFQMLQI